MKPAVMSRINWPKSRSWRPKRSMSLFMWFLRTDSPIFIQKFEHNATAPTLLRGIPVVIPNDSISHGMGCHGSAQEEIVLASNKSLRLGVLQQSRQGPWLLAEGQGFKQSPLLGWVRFSKVNVPNFVPYWAISHPNAYGKAMVTMCEFLRSLEHSLYRVFTVFSKAHDGNTYPIYKQ